MAGMNLKKAYTYLADVQDHKQVVPFRRFAGSIGRSSQAKAFKTTKGALRSCWICHHGNHLMFRSMAREIRQIHPCPFEECRVERRCQRPLR